MIVLLTPGEDVFHHGLRLGLGQRAGERAVLQRLRRLRSSGRPHPRGAAAAGGHAETVPRNSGETMRLFFTSVILREFPFELHQKQTYIKRTFPWFHHNMLRYVVKYFSLFCP